MPKSPHTEPDKHTPAGVLESIAALTTQRDRHLLSRTLVNTLFELIPCNRITMYHLSPADQGEEAILVAEACNHPENASTHSEVGIAISNRADFNSVINSGKAHNQTLGNHTSHSIYPVTSQHGVVALLEMVSEVPKAKNGDRHLILAFLKIYSNYLSILDESETDTLTGLLNRRTFDNNIEKIIAERYPPDEEQNDSVPLHPARRAINVELPHWLAVIDIDHFKRVNDKFGHLYGDEVLLLLARNMRRIFRKRDKLFRFGGEEFVVVLDRTSLENAQCVLERFRVEIEQYYFPQVGQITISVGFVRLDKVDVSSSIIGRADQALYYAKEHGRNRVCFYEDLVAEHKLDGEHYSDDVQLF